MRVFLAGATGVIGRQLLPLLLDDGRVVAGMTRSPHKAPELAALGVVPVVCDVYDAQALEKEIVDFGPDLVMHQLTDLPDEAGQLPAFVERNNRIRTEGTRNLVHAARAAGTRRFVAQSIAWTPPSGGTAVAEHERLVLEVTGVVLRYGMFYGPGTYSGTERPPPPPRVRVEDAARMTMDALDLPSGIVVIAEPDGGDAPA